jgi:hypothetical protein
MTEQHLGDPTVEIKAGVNVHLPPANYCIPVVIAYFLTAP